MRFTLSLFAIVFFSPFAGAQLSFQKAYGGSQPENNECMNKTTGAICAIPDGGYAVFHSSISYSHVANQQCGYLLRLDAAGDTLWTKTFNASPFSQTYGRSIFHTSDGGFILGADFTGIGLGLIKTDANGDTLWTARFRGMNTGNITGYFGFPFNDGGYGGCGYTGPMTMNSGYAGMIGKVDHNGQQVFSSIFDSNGSGNNIELFSACATFDGGMVATGGYYANNYSDILLVKADSLGVIQWAKTYAGGLYQADEGFTVKELPDHSFIVAGYTTSFGPGDSEAMLMKTDSAGNMLFSMAYGDSLFQWSNSVVQAADGGFVLCGMTADPANTTTGNAILIKTDAAGTMQWSRSYGSWNDDIGNSITLAPDQGFAFTGFTKSFGSGGYDIYVVKTDSTGYVPCYSGLAGFTAVPAPFTQANAPYHVYSAAVSVAPYPCAIGAGTVITAICTNVGIEETETPVLSDVYPNPAGDELFVKTTGAGMFTAQLYAADGRLVWEAPPAFATAGSEIQLKLPALPGGMYFLRCTDGMESSARKIILRGDR